MSSISIDNIRALYELLTDAKQEEMEALREKVLALRGDLAMARAQRDGAQKALDKANRDNDMLRAELRSLGLSSPAAPTFDEHFTKSLVDGGVIYNLAGEAE